MYWVRKLSSQPSPLVSPMSRKDAKSWFLPVYEMDRTRQTKKLNMKMKQDELVQLRLERRLLDARRVAVQHHLGLVPRVHHQPVHPVRVHQPRAAQAQLLVADGEQQPPAAVHVGCLLRARGRRQHLVAGLIDVHLAGLHRRRGRRPRAVGVHLQARLELVEGGVGRLGLDAPGEAEQLLGRGGRESGARGHAYLGHGLAVQVGRVDVGGGVGVGGGDEDDVGGELLVLVDLHPLANHDVLGGHGRQPLLAVVVALGGRVHLLHLHLGRPSCCAALLCHHVLRTALTVARAEHGRHGGRLVDRRLRADALYGRLRAGPRHGRHGVGACLVVADDSEAAVVSDVVLPVAVPVLHALLDGRHGQDDGQRDDGGVDGERADVGDDLDEDAGQEVHVGEALELLVQVEGEEGQQRVLGRLDEVGGEALRRVGRRVVHVHGEGARVAGVGGAGRAGHRIEGGAGQIAGRARTRGCTAVRRRIRQRTTRIARQPLAQTLAEGRSHGRGRGRGRTRKREREAQSVW